MAIPVVAAYRDWGPAFWTCRRRPPSPESPRTAARPRQSKEFCFSISWLVPSWLLPLGSGRAIRHHRGLLGSQLLLFFPLGCLFIGALLGRGHARVVIGQMAGVAGVHFLPAHFHRPHQLFPF